MNQSLEVPRRHLGVQWYEQNHFSLHTADGTVFHIDPFLSRVLKPENHIHPEPLIQPEDTYADYVFLTHDHRDHTDPYTLVPMSKRNTSCRFIGSAESVARCTESGIDPSRMRAVSAGDTIEEGGVRVDVIYAENTGTDFTPHMGFVFRFPRAATVYVTGDTRNDISRYVGKLSPVAELEPDLMIVPINEGYNNPGPDGATAIVELTKPRLIVPCHFGCFRNNTIDPDRFLERLPSKYAAVTTILERGGSLLVPSR